jgi:ATP-dependent RNA helicase DDX42
MQDPTNHPYYSFVRFDPDEMGFDMHSNGKKEITPLPRVDHSRQNYVEIEKCFYEEHEDIARLTNEQVKQIRMDLGKLLAH